MDTLRHDTLFARLTALFIVTGLVLVLAAGSALADDNNGEDPVFPPALAQDLPNPGLLPDHPLYPLKTLIEKFQLLATTGPEARAERMAALIERRTAEIVEMKKIGNETAANRVAAAQARLADRAFGQLGQVAKGLENGAGGDNGKAVSAFESVGEATQRAQGVLRHLLGQNGDFPGQGQGPSDMPEGALQGLQNALDAITQGRLRVADVLANRGAQGVGPGGEGPPGLNKQLLESLGVPKGSDDGNGDNAQIPEDVPPGQSQLPGEVPPN